MTITSQQIFFFSVFPKTAVASTKVILNSQNFTFITDSSSGNIIYIDVTTYGLQSPNSGVPYRGLPSLIRMSNRITCDVMINRWIRGRRCGRQWESGMLSLADPLMKIKIRKRWLNDRDLEQQIFRQRPQSDRHWRRQDGLIVHFAT